MREQVYLRIFLALLVVASLAHYLSTRDQLDLVAAFLFGIVTVSTGRRRPGAFLGATAAAAVVLVIRLHQLAVGMAQLSVLFAVNLFLPWAALVLGALAWWKVSRGSAE